LAFVAWLFILVFSSACYKGEKAFHPAAKSVYDIPYAKGLAGDDLLKLDVHTPKDGGKNLPVIVYIHGGGWTKSDKSEMNQWAQRMADRGYVVFNVNYRLAPKFPFPTAVNDCLGAMYWISQHAAEYGGDVNRMGITGGSAGGHLIAMISTAWNDPHFKPTGYEDKKLSLAIKAQVPFFGVFNFDRPGFMGLTKIPRTFLGGTKKQVPENYRLASPINYVTKDTPPTLVIVGGLDPIYSQSKMYHDALQKAGVHVEMKIYPLQTHGFDFQFWRKSSKDAFQRMMAFFSRYLKD
jgi:acetyl esterase/lipase